MSNPLRILSTLNKHLTAPAEITVFGRSSLALGYDHVPTEIQSTHDVDGILPLHWLELADQAGDFWQAIQSTNLELAPEGLYLTHLFREFDVILQPDWVTRRVEISRSGFISVSGQ